MQLLKRQMAAFVRVLIFFKCDRVGVRMHSAAYSCLVCFLSIFKLDFSATSKENVQSNELLSCV